LKPPILTKTGGSMFEFIGNKEVLGGLSVVIMVVAYGVQIGKTLFGKAEPHPITWFGFGFLTGAGYLVQFQKGAGAGSWVMGFTTLFCFLVGLASQHKRRWRLRDFDFWDYLALALGIGLFLLYVLSRNISWGPLVSAVFVTAADLVLYYPMLKKTWWEPHSDTAVSYGLNSLKFIPSLFAMEAYSWETCLYPAILIVANAGVVVYLWWRRNLCVNV